MTQQTKLTEQFLTPEEVNNFYSQIVRVLDNGYVNHPASRTVNGFHFNKYQPSSEMVNFQSAFSGDFFKSEQGQQKKYSFDIKFDRQEFAKIEKEGLRTAFAGCYPQGIEKGCAKYIECDQKDSCPLIEVELQYDVDMMPKLRKCQYLGCVRPERAEKWLKNPNVQGGLNKRQKWTINAVDEVNGLQNDNETAVGSLDELCPHHFRVWENIEYAFHQQKTAPRKNPFRTLQCEISRPSSCNTHVHTDSPKDLNKRHNSFDIPHGWYNRLGYSGVGIIVVAKPEDLIDVKPEDKMRTSVEDKEADNVFYLQLSSKRKELRDYYEFPYFAMGERPIENKNESQQDSYPNGVLLQLLFRSLRETKDKEIVDKGTADTSQLPEVLHIFGDNRAEYLSDWEEANKVLYCPAGELAAWLFMWGLLANESDTKRRIEKFDEEWDRLINDELDLTADAQQKIKDTLTRMLVIKSDVNPLKELGFIKDNDVPSMRGKALLSWLLALHLVLNKQQDSNQDFRFCHKVVETAKNQDSALHNLLDVFARMLGEKISKKDSNGQTSNETCCAAKKRAAFKISLVDLATRYGVFTGSIKDRMLDSLLDNSRFPVLPYLAWWRLSHHDYLLGHFVVPLGSGDRFSGEAIYSDQDSRFLLAGVDETLWMSHYHNEVDYDDDSFAAMEKKLHDIIPITSRLVAPVSDATISYTFFQLQAKEEKQKAETQGMYKAHQMNGVLYVMSEKLRTMRKQYNEGDGIIKGNTWQHLLDQVEQLDNENTVFLSHTTGRLTDHVINKIKRRLTLDEIHEEMKELIEQYVELLAVDKNEALEVEFIHDGNARTLDKFYYPEPFIASILNELIKNYNKYSCGKVQITFEIVEKTLQVDFQAQTKEGSGNHNRGYRLGNDAIKNIYKFITGTDFKLENYFTPQGNDYVSLIPFNFRHIDQQVSLLIEQSTNQS